MPTAAPHTEITCLATYIACPPANELTALTALLVELMMSGAKSDGFWNGEIVPPRTTKQPSWQLLQRFNTAKQADLWQESPRRLELLKELEAITKMAPTTASEQLFSDSDAPVCTAIVTDVKAGMEEQYFAWEAQIQKVQATFPGYAGIYWQPPAPGRQNQWATLLRFDSPAALEGWFHSAERRELLGQAEKFISNTSFQRVNSLYPGWFPIDTRTGQLPPRWKTIMLILLGLYPVVMLELKFITPFFSVFDDALVKFINLVGSVMATTWVTMPLFIKWFAWWLFPEKDAPAHTTILGVLLLIGLFFIEITLISYLHIRR